MDASMTVDKSPFTKSAFDSLVSVLPRADMKDHSSLFENLFSYLANSVDFDSAKAYILIYFYLDSNNQLERMTDTMKTRFCSLNEICFKECFP